MRGFTRDTAGNMTSEGGYGVIRTNLQSIPLRVVLCAYAAVVFVAVIFDVVTDRTFGALVVATLPIGAIAQLCLLFGPWTTKQRSTLLIGWALGMALILGFTVFFAARGAEESKVAETIFAYAGLVAAFPTSLIYPIAAANADSAGLMPAHPIARVVATWIFVVGAGSAQWWLIASMRNLLWRQPQP